MQQNTKNTTSDTSLPDNLAQSKIHKHFRLGEVMTEDVTGTLYSAATTIKGREVAVNVLAPKCTILSKKLIKIEHPNICKVYKMLKLPDGAFAVIIEKPKGKPILRFIEESRAGAGFSTGQAISAVLQLLSALHAIHKTKQTARNLSVNNLFLYRDKNDNLRLKLISCGIGDTGVNLKTPHYQSPERIMDVDKGDVRADIWAAGAIFYHLLFRRPPFRGDDSYEVARKNLLEDPDFQNDGGAIPEKLIDIVKRALHRDESKRYQTVTEMVNDLLPLREDYNEPMSEEVSKALRKSYPPPAKSSTFKASSKAPRKDPTAEYGTRKKDTLKEKVSQTLLFQSAAHKNAPEQKAAPVVRTAQKKAAPKRTLLGMPAMSLEAAQKELEAVRARAESPSGESLGEEAAEDFFSPRSILGSEDDIKVLESEFGFLDSPESDGEIPTRVVSQDTFSAFAGRINELTGLTPEGEEGEATGDSEPSPGPPKQDKDVPQGDAEPKPQPKPAPGDVPEPKLKTERPKFSGRPRIKPKTGLESKLSAKSGARVGTEPRSTPARLKDKDGARPGAGLSSRLKDKNGLGGGLKPRPKFSAKPRVGPSAELKPGFPTKRGVGKSALGRRPSAAPKPRPRPKPEAISRDQRPVAPKKESPPAEEHAATKSRSFAPIDVQPPKGEPGAPPRTETPPSVIGGDPPEKPDSIAALLDAAAEGSPRQSDATPVEVDTDTDAEALAIGMAPTDSNLVEIPQEVPRLPLQGPLSPPRRNMTMSTIMMVKTLAKRRLLAIGIASAAIAIIAVPIVLLATGGASRNKTPKPEDIPFDLSKPVKRPHGTPEGPVESPEASPRTGPGPVAPKSQKPPKPQKAKQPATPDRAKTPSPKPAPPETISIHLIGIPAGSIVKVNGKRAKLPIERPRSAKPATVSIISKGYKPYSTKIVWDRDKEIAVSLEKKPAPKGTKKTKGKPPKKSGGKPEKKEGPLLSNPFKM